jgi:hypothetical protein
MSKAKATKNPIATEGLKLDEIEYEVVSNVLAAAAKQCQGKQQKIYKTLLRVLGRMSQAVGDGQGVRDDQLIIYQKRIHHAFAAEDEKALQLAVEDLIASTFRSDADPGLKVARYLMQLVTHVLAAQARHGLATLNALSPMVETAIAEWNAEGWPDGAAVAQWISEVILAGKQDLELGQEPWVLDPEADAGDSSLDAEASTDVEHDDGQR